MSEKKHTNDPIRVTNKFPLVLNSISQLLGKISGIAILIMVILVTFNVLTRKLMNWSIPGFYEILGLIGAILYSFGIVYAAIKGEHIMMDLVFNRLPVRIKRVCTFFVRLTILAFCILFTYAGYTIVLTMLDERTFDVRIPVAPFRFMVIFAFMMLAFIILSGKKIGKGGE